jgi:alpha-tubulin suppressor-like RCC1 family protein
MRVLFFAIFLIFNAFTHAQQSRRENQKSSYQSNYQRIAHGKHSFHNAEIREGKLWVWGYNVSGQLGLGHKITKPGRCKSPLIVIG